MKIKFYGSSHGLPEPDRFCTSVRLEAGDRHYLIDTGAPIIDMLIRDGLRPEDVRAMFITHLHGDHVDGIMPYLNLASWYYTDSDPEIFTPSIYLKDAVNAWLKLAFRTIPREFKFREIAEGEIYSDGVIRVRAFMTEHHTDTRPDHRRSSYGFAVEELASGKKILFTGDLRDDIKDFPSTAFTEHFDAIVTEGAHPDIDECADILSKCQTDRLIIGHIAPKVTTPERVDRLRSLIPHSVTVAEDGDVFCI